MLSKTVLNHLKPRFNIRFNIGKSQPSNRATMCTVESTNKHDEKFKMIYRLEEMHIISVVSRAKVFQGACTVLVTPLMAAAEFVNLVPENTAITAAIIGTYICMVSDALFQICVQ